MKEKEGNTIRKAVINNAINYIFDHIDEEITVDDVANYCSYSKYHLTRMFKEDMNEALYQFIKRVRLERSAWRLKVEKESSFSNGITLDELEDAGKRITIEHIESFTAIYERKKEIIIICPRSGVHLLKSMNIWRQKKLYTLNAQLMTRPLQTRITVCMSCARQFHRSTLS